MGPFEMVVAIVGITAVASVIRARHTGGGGRTHRWRRASFASRRDGGDWHQSDWQQSDTFDGDENRDLATENRLLRDELHGLKERIQVLERLATDDESDARRLDREIEKLRDRPPLTGAAQNKE